MSIRRLQLVVVTVALTSSLAPARMTSADEVTGEPAMVQSGGSRFGAYDVRNEVDRRDTVERFALLLPGGPLVVEVTMTIDGEPFRVRRERLIDEILAAGDMDESGVVTWEEALQNPLFTFGRIFPERQRTQYIGMLDRDRNGQVDRIEARGFMAVVFQGPAFVAASGSARSADGGGPSDVRATLDTDQDGVLSESEIAAAGEALIAADADNDELLYSDEIVGVDSNYRSRRELYAAGQHVALLGPAILPADLFITIRDKYQAENGVVVPASFRAVPQLFDRLDADNDRVLSRHEITDFNDVEPHVRLTVDLAESEGDSTLSLTYVEGGRRREGDMRDAARIELSGADVTFEVGTAGRREFDYAGAARRMLDMYDNDGNQYLELSELPSNFGPQFEVWDVDADGKVFGREIVDGYVRLQRPLMTRILAGVRRSGDPLLDALDLSGDSRLGLREMKTAQVQLAALDEDGDGQIAQREIPVSYTVNFRISTGDPARMAVPASQSVADATAGAPAWFVRMDRNGDGDVTLKEFLGDRDGFEALDANSDGFIEPAEAEVASVPESDEK